MIIGVIGERFSGKKTFINFIKELYPDTKMIISDTLPLKRDFIKVNEENDVLKNKYDSPEFKINELISKDSTWLENHTRVMDIIEEFNSKQSMTNTNEKKEKEKSNGIKDKIRGLRSNIIIYNFTLEDFHILQSKSSLRLVHICSNTKKRFSNFISFKKKQYEYKEDCSSEYFKEFLDNDEEYMKTFPREFYKVTRTYNIANDTDLDSFFENTKKFWEHVTTSYRPSWDDYFMTIAENLADRSNCIKLKVGAITVKNNRILSSGFNGTPNHLPNCFEGGCPRCKSNSKQGENLDLCICIHAEINCIIEIGIDKLDGATMYVTFFPCLQCCKQIIQSGIKKVVFKNEYDSEFSKALFKQSNMEVKKYVPQNLIFDKDFDNFELYFKRKMERMNESNK